MCFVNFRNNFFSFQNIVEHHTDYVRSAAMDGTKLVCLDELYVDLKNKSCLIYSFGLADDWTFEEYMASLGCKVKDRVNRMATYNMSKITCSKIYVEPPIGSEV